MSWKDWKLPEGHSPREEPRGLPPRRVPSTVDDMTAEARSMAADSSTSTGSMVNFVDLHDMVRTRVDALYFLGVLGRAAICLRLSSRWVHDLAGVQRGLRERKPTLHFTDYLQGGYPILRAVLFLPVPGEEPLMFESALRLTEGDVQEFYLAAMRTEKIELHVSHAVDRKRLSAACAARGIQRVLGRAMGTLRKVPLPSDDTDFAPAADRMREDFPDLTGGLSKDTEITLDSIGKADNIVRVQLTFGQEKGISLIDLPAAESAKDVTEAARSTQPPDSICSSRPGQSPPADTSPEAALPHMRWWERLLRWSRYRPRVALSKPSSQPTRDDAEPDVNSIIDAARNLPGVSDAEIEENFLAIRDTWDAREVLTLVANDLRAVIIETLCGDMREGFSVRQVHPLVEPESYLQFNTISDSALVAGRGTFRGYRIVKREDGRFALYGHAAMYRYRDIYQGSKHYVGSLDPLVRELLVIGLNGYLDGAGGQASPPAREIGAQLDSAGGITSMQAAHSIVSEKLGRREARCLEVAWDGVGDWIK